MSCRTFQSVTEWSETEDVTSIGGRLQDRKEGLRWCWRGEAWEPNGCHRVSILTLWWVCRPRSNLDWDPAPWGPCPKSHRHSCHPGQSPMCVCVHSSGSSVPNKCPIQLFHPSAVAISYPLSPFWSQIYNWDHLESMPVLSRWLTTVRCLLGRYTLTVPTARAGSAPLAGGPRGGSMEPAFVKMGWGRTGLVP